MIFDTIGTSSGITYNTSTGLFSLKAGVTYEFETNLYVQFEGSTGYISNYQWVDSSNNALSPTQGQAIPVTSGYNDSGVASQSLIYTPSQDINVKVRWVGVYGGRMLVQGIKTWAKVKQINPTIAIQSTATGTMNKNFIKYTRTASQSVSANSVVICNVLEASSGNVISPNTTTGQITLTSGKTYRLRGTVGTIVGATAASYIGYGWYNETTSTWIGEGAQIISPQSLNYNVSNGGTAEVVITTNASTVVSLRVILVTNVTSIGGNQSDFTGTYANPWIDIEEIGSTFALTSISGLTTTSDLNVGGNLTVTGSISVVSGSITMPNRPAFRVTGAGGATASTTVLSGSMTVVDYNQSNAWNNSNGTFTAPIAGLYQVNLVARCNSNSSPTAQVIVLKNNTTISPINGTAQVMLEWAANTTANHIGGSTISKLAVGDTLKVIVTVGTISFDANDNFSIAYIG